MIGSNYHAKRMVKVHVARAPQNTYSPSTASTTVQEASGPTHSSVSVSLPTSTATLAGVISFLGVALIIVVGIYLYRRHKNRSVWKRKTPAVEFDPNAFTVEKKGMQQQQRTESPMIPVRSHTYQASVASKDSDDSSTTSESGAGWRPQASPVTTTTTATTPKFRVTNENRGSAPALPKILTDKKRPSRAKAWTDSLALSLDDSLVRSPPPSYDLANSAGPEFLIPVPTMMPVEKGRRAAPTPPTPPAHSSRKSIMSAVAKASSSKPSTPVTPLSSASSMYVQTLTVPVKKDDDAPPSVSSPARSESFAPKDLMMPSPPSSATTSKTKNNSPPSANPFASSEDSYYSGNTSTTSSSSSNSNSIKHKTPRMMHVIAHYTPTLSDELRVHVGDTVKVLEEYKDGWCFAQYVGKADAPKGVVPLICLEERLRMVPVAHSRSPNGSLSSLSSWRH
ncbi:hypothetical protein JR316_0003904 [Psilocybe cubensis]|uniref:SH3 domain-containing protein n=2 Tax=Psilocybe cubensis TaxID=181762 RepID=A0A8H7Y1L6_PSICU|nr:hypothetical protein JR316_0003904 [Psilocybe cubensis]KAH9484422.1 hypothetical protein JR316_0003904 [Psilocybe cubensis]